MPRLSASLSVLLLLLASAQSRAQDARPAVPASSRSNRACISPSQRLDEQGFVQLGGIEQWVTIKGSRCSNPVVLFLHGGPGNPLSPFASTVYGAWEKDFTLVQWDQRGAGRTYGRSRPGEESTLTLEQMTADGVELAEYLTRRLGKRKLILMGSSWGSVLGVHMLQARPGLFHAYVGTAQLVSTRDNQRASYDALLERARGAGDAEAVATLEGLGAPPWANPRNPGILRRLVRKYEAKATTAAPREWWVPAPEYATPAALADAEAGDDYSYLQFVGLKGDGMAARVNLPELGTAFDVPFFLVQGAEDLLTRPEVTRRYFERVMAPRKELVLVPLAGHDANRAIVEAQHMLLTQRIRPALREGMSSR